MPSSLRTFPLSTLMAVGAALLPLGCSFPTDTLTESFTVELNFRSGDHGWVGGFSDFHPDQEDGMELVAELQALPGSLDDTGTGLFTAGTNHSDDLFMFWKRHQDGFPPGMRLRVRFMVEFASEAPTGCAGIGGAPGESVFVKAGVSQEEPTAVLSDEDGPYWSMNIDKGNQAEEGFHARVLGHIGNQASGCSDPVWELKTLEEHGAFETIVGSAGSFWLFFGTDSGFEGRTRLYFTRFRAIFEPV
jgi:hypothetical protein